MKCLKLGVPKVPKIKGSLELGRYKNNEGFSRC